jgi:hypothetical protein
VKAHMAALAALLVSATTLAQTSDPVAGVWEQIPGRNVTSGETQRLEAPPLRIIFSDGYFVQFRAAANRAKIQVPREQMTKEQLLERYNIQGQYGTYRISAGRLVRKTLVAADPNNEGREGASDFRVERDVLIISNRNAQGQTLEGHYKRLSPIR